MSLDGSDFACRQRSVGEVVQSLERWMIGGHDSASINSLRARCSCARIVPSARPVSSAISP
jgi:hypothetical protein